jgi:ribosome-binding ATPase YchF (GTP1/OBG family)
MRVALVGLPGSGKTTVFNAVAEKPVDSPAGALQTETHVQVVKVHDERLEALRDLFQPKKFTPAGLEVWDPPGLPPGAGEADRERRMRRLSRLRDADAYVLVLRDFRSDSYAYERPEPDPQADLQWLVGEMLSSDYVIAESRAEKLRERILRKARSVDQDRLELAVLEKCLARLEAGQDLVGLGLDEADAKRIKGFQFFMRSPMLALVNGARGVPDGFGRGIAHELQGVTTMDAQIDAELNAMDPEDRPAFMEEFGIDAPARDRFVRDVYQGVGLRSFFTVGDEEVRAWTIRAGETALKAASKVHTDLAKGFVRAEVYDHEELLAAGSLRDAKGVMRLEHKDYVVQDGEVVHIRSAL